VEGTAGLSVTDDSMDEEKERALETVGYITYK
jgi:hypothetical protein